MAKAVKGKKAGVRFANSTKFFKGVWYELKKVNWPTRKDLGKHTAVVITLVALVSLIVWIMDMGFGKLLETII